MSRSPRHLVVPAAVTAVLTVALCAGALADSGSSMMFFPGKQGQQCLLQTSPRQCLASWLRQLGRVANQLPGSHSSQGALLFSRPSTPRTDCEALSFAQLDLISLPAPLPPVQLHLLNLPPPAAAI